MRTELDPYLARYADRARNLRASEIRALFAVASRPEVISFAGGMPATDHLDFDVIREVTDAVLADEGPTALQYGGGQGVAALRESIVEVMATESIAAHADELVITVGGQQALELIGKTFLDSGNVVVAEGPTYVGALGAFASHQAHIEHVAMDDDGLQTDELEQRLTDLRAQGRRCELLYVIPNHQNPAGVSMSRERRERVAELAEEHDLLVLEDNPYGLLSFDGSVLPSIRSMIPDRTVYVGTMSKTFAPGVRIGWVAAPRHVRDKLVMLREAADLCPANLTQMIVDRWLRTADWNAQVEAFRKVYEQRARAMTDALADKMPPGVTWSSPSGGFYVWLRLPDGVTATTLLPKALQQRVAFVPGTGFFADGTGSDHLRLCYSHPPAERITAGVARLAEAIESERRLAEALDLGRTAGDNR